VTNTGLQTQADMIPNTGLDNLGITVNTVHWNVPAHKLVEAAIQRNEGRLSAQGAFVAETGEHTGRSAQDKFTVRDEHTEDQVWWDNNKPMTPANFDALYEDFITFANGREELFVQDLLGGADLDHRLPVRVVGCHAWHSLFIQHLLIQPEAAEHKDFDPQFTIVHMPEFRADPEKHGTRTGTVIAVNFTKRLVLIGGTSYAGEMKKSVFTILNYLLPAKSVMPMHCSINVGDEGDSAIFFGLSGTGKTTLSADPNRTLVGDDEHGWSENGVFNFEGGCYAKMINLSAEAEPEIYATTQRFATVLENVVMDENGILDLDDGSLTENTRGAYPISYIPNSSETGRAGHPKNIIMLTADAFGVLPPIAKLTPSQAMYHFLSGYTAKVAGTEKGVTEPEATFSTCFGGPFMPRHPSEYGNLLRKLIAEHGVDCWLVNTGWTGGTYGVGSRMPIKETRALLNAALDGSLRGAEFRTDENFGFEVPVTLPGVNDALLDPRGTWADGAAYDAQAQKLVGMFIDNFSIYEAHVDPDVIAAAPIKAA